MEHIRIVNLTRETLLGNRIELADSWWGRSRGFLGRAQPRKGEGILFVPCNAVHTYGMKFDLDLVFVGSAGGVLAVVEQLEPWRRSGRVRGSRYVLEVPAGTIRATGTAVGDTFSWTPVNSSPRLSRSLHEHGRSIR
jgi:uncharacterized membrane protein (UPF0127 family)